MDTAIWFFSLPISIDAWTLDIGPYWSLIRYQCLIDKLYASLCGKDWHKHVFSNFYKQTVTNIHIDKNVFYCLGY